jgi:amino acid permease
MCLTGVDYFSTLGYQPSIAFGATGLLAPLATLVLVAVTLGGALPMYAYVAGESPHGQGSISMLERLMRGWTGKICVLVLLGFATTGFVITKTLSAADAAVHLIENPFWQSTPEFVRGVASDRQRMLITMLLLVALGAMFLRGFREVIGWAVAIVGVYLALNLLVIGSGLYYLLRHPGKLERWYELVTQGVWHIPEEHALPVMGHDWWTIALVCVVLFPKLALGLSGFETGVAVMPLVQGDPQDEPARPAGRIRNTRKLLLTAALIMSFYLVGSAVVTSTLIDPLELQEQAVRDLTTGEIVREVKGRAVDRALAYLAHGEGGTDAISPLFGEWFGTMYDISTIVILWFAGSSAMAGLLNLVPQYLPRYGMAPEWAQAVRPLVVLFTIINLAVTWIFDADVDAQGGAYATGVLVLMTSGCVATVIDRWRKRRGSWLVRTPWAYVLITLVFLYTTGANMVEQPDGIKISSCFIAAMLVSSMVSRTVRSTELRFEGFEFVDAHAKFLWESIKYLEFPVLVPHRPEQDPRALEKKERAIRESHRLGPEVPIVFVEAHLGDVSEFYQTPLMEVRQEEGRFVLKITRCASIAHVIAAVALECSKVGRPPEIHFGWSDESPLAMSMGFVLFGEGNVPWMVRELIRRAEPNAQRQPQIIVG